LASAGRAEWVRFFESAEALEDGAAGGFVWRAQGRAEWVRFFESAEGAEVVRQMGSFAKGGRWIGFVLQNRRRAGATAPAMGSFGEGRVRRRGPEIYANEPGIEMDVPIMSCNSGKMIQGSARLGATGPVESTQQARDSSGGRQLTNKSWI